MLAEWAMSCVGPSTHLIILFLHSTSICCLHSKMIEQGMCLKGAKFSGKFQHYTISQIFTSTDKAE